MLRRRITSLLSSSSLQNVPIYGEPIKISQSIFTSSQKFPFLQFSQRPISSIGSLGSQFRRAYSLLSLNDLQDNKGARKQKTRKGRGIGSGKGKTAGRGHKGQKARGTYKFGFEGGQTPLRRRVPKRGFKNPFSLTFQPVGLGKIANLINAGKIDSSELITMKTLKDSGAIGKQIEDGARLMGRGAELIQWPIHLEVSRVTARAKAAVEAAGGSVRRVHYNKLGLRALLKPGLLHCMLEGENLNYYQQRKNNGESKLCTGPFRPVAAFTWVPSGNCASIANNIQLEWYLLLLLPLGQASISPSILRQQHRSRSRRRPFIFEI